MSLTRRAIVKILGSTPAVLPMAAAEAPKLLALAEPLAAGGLLMGGQPINAPGERTGLGKIVGKQLEDLRDRFDAEEWWSQAMRVNGIDPDIAALKSTSATYKALRMVERHRARFSLTHRVRRALWG